MEDSSKEVNYNEVAIECQLIKVLCGLLFPSIENNLSGNFFSRNISSGFVEVQTTLVSCKPLARFT